jgi:hypothetical protein
VAVQTQLRIASQQVAAQHRQIVGKVGHDLARVSQLFPLLELLHLDERSLERRATRKRLVQHHAGAVPIGGVGQPRASGLLRRHVAGRADDGQVARRGRRRGSQLGDQAEVEQHDAALAGHLHVRRLDVAVQLPGFVQRQQSRAQLGESLLEAGDVGADGSRRFARSLVIEVTAGIAEVSSDLFRARDVESRLRWLAGGRGARRQRRSGGAHPLDEAAAAYQLHGEEPLVAIGQQLVQRHQVAMAQIGERSKLPLEEIERVGIEPLEGLEGQGELPLTIEGLIDDTKPALADAAGNGKPRSPVEFTTFVAHPLVPHRILDGPPG